MSPKIAVLFIAFFSIGFFLNCGAVKKDLFTPDPSAQNYLAIYGQWVYESSSCGNCHTQKVGRAGDKLVSLDGLGGKYPHSWLHLLLEDPNVLIPDSKMPSYRYLSVKPLSRKVVRRIAEEHAPSAKLEEEAIWNEVNAQADQLARELEADQAHVGEERTAMLALIAYLQQIPSSKKQLAIYRKGEKEAMKTQRKWEKILADSSNLISQFAKDEHNIPKGRLLFLSYCSVCHGEHAKGMIGPDLTDDRWIHGGSEMDIARTILQGVPEKGMISWRDHLSPEEVGELVAYISSLSSTQAD